MVWFSRFKNWRIGDKLEHGRLQADGERHKLSQVHRFAFHRILERAEGNSPFLPSRPQHDLRIRVIRHRLLLINIPESDERSGRVVVRFAEDVQSQDDFSIGNARNRPVPLRIIQGQLDPRIE